MDDQRLQDDIIKQLLSEVIEEEIVNLLEKAIVEDESRTSLTSGEISRRQDLLAREFGEDILNDVMEVEIASIAGECFDDIIANHRRDLDAVQRMNSILHYIVQEMLEDIVLDVVGEKVSQVHRGIAFEVLLSEVIAEECETVAKNVIDHYHMRIALSKYKQIQTSANGFVMDNLLLESLLLPHSDDLGSPSMNSDGKHFQILPEESDKMLNDILLDILLSQSLALHSCFPKNLPTKVFKDVSTSKLQPIECLPLNWYKDKLVTSIAEDVVVTMLCDRLDESMQISTEEHMKNEAVSLVTQLLDT